MRYDLAPVPFILAGVLLLLGKPSLRRSIVAGLLVRHRDADAVLRRFHLPYRRRLPLATKTLPPQQRLKLIGGLLGAAALVGLPYGVYILSDYDAFQGQAGTIDSRGDFNKPSFYVNNLIHEPDRFIRPLAFKEVPLGADHEKVSPRIPQPAGDGPPAPVRQAGGARRPAAGAGLRRPAGAEGQGARRPACCCSASADWCSQFALVRVGEVLHLLDAGRAVPLHRHRGGDVVAAADDGTKAALGCSIAVACVLALLVVFGEGSVARLDGLRTAPNATNYERLADRIHEYVPAGLAGRRLDVAVVGHARHRLSQLLPLLLHDPPRRRALQDDDQRLPRRLPPAVRGADPTGRSASSRSIFRPVTTPIGRPT